MGDMYEKTDEISLFLQQILVRSSSSSSSSLDSTSSAAMRTQFSDNRSRMCRSQVVGDGISAVDSSGAYLLGSTSGVLGPNVSSSSVGVSENENDEYDCESEV